MSKVPKRRWFRFSLRTLLVVTAALCIWLGFEKSRALKQVRVMERVHQRDGNVFLASRFDSSGEPKLASTPGGGFSGSYEPPVPRWIVALLGQEYFLKVVTVNFDNDVPRPSDKSKAHGSKATNESLSLLQDTPDVRELLLACNGQLTDECLVHAAGLKYLRVITLEQTGVNGSGLRDVRNLPSLEGLSLGDTPMTDDGLAFLKDLPKLEWLLLDDTQIMDKGLSHLVSIKSLRHLSLNNTKVTNEGLAELRRSLPNCTIFPR